jgi:hypothetical protein
MTIKTSDGDDIITGGMESDSLTGGTGADDFIMSDVVAGAASVKMDTITDFTVADTDQVGNFGLTDLKTLTILTNLVELDDPAGQSVAADDAVVTDTIAAATDLADVTATTNLLILDADLDDTDAVADALEDSGSLELTAGTAFAAADGFLVAYDDGTDSYIALVTTDAIVAADGTFAADDLTVTNLVTLTGVADCTDLTDASFLDFIA